MDKSNVAELKFIDKDYMIGVRFKGNKDFIYYIPPPRLYEQLKKELMMEKKNE